MSDQGDLVFDGNHLRATLFGGAAGSLLITFSFREKGRKDFNAVQWSKSAKRRGFSQLCIATRANDWFINADTTALEDCLQSLSSQYKTVHMMGFSMGGYGAFRFAQAARADFVLAMSPQFSIHPDAVPFDRRFRADAQGFDPALGDLVIHAQTNLQGVIVVDPFRALDRVNAQMIMEVFPRVRLARLGFGGHPATTLLRRLGRSGVIQNMALEAPPHPAPIIAAHRAARVDDAAYLHDLKTRWQGR